MDLMTVSEEEPTRTRPSAGRDPEGRITASYAEKGETKLFVKHGAENHLKVGSGPGVSLEIKFEGSSCSGSTIVLVD